MFPESLQPYQKIIESTAIPAVLMSFKEEKTTLYQSKIGGEPYFPNDYPPDYFYVPYPDTVNYTPWPKHPKTGRELMLLIQINFEEMPPLPSFPRTGILQLFVDDRHWHYLERHLLAIYHPKVIRKDELLFSNFNNSLDAYRVQEHSISFQKDVEYMTYSDFRFDQLLPYADTSKDERFWKDYSAITDYRFSRQEKEVMGYGYGRNKIGGYHFSQNGQDPRGTLPEWKDSLLLVQFQDYERLSWGDLGSAQFFIKRKDLEELNFQDLLFHWDST
ncbi:YwqG family protein [Chitinophaga sp. CF418]|uniref:YwqG family protein n=1 Tax=Chitinophaga sp. CF418 TaxID=1855287 RepID=UPI00091D838A|nr:DUF1963 domain-containing protein [Chitinophaga sp. CF418]SHN36073.1 Uncharacterized protein YwqG [Chitinophaga sp. CF418]